MGSRIESGMTYISLSFDKLRMTKLEFEMEVELEVERFLDSALNDNWKDFKYYSSVRVFELV